MLGVVFDFPLVCLGNGRVRGRVGWVLAGVAPRTVHGGVRHAISHPSVMLHVACGQPQSLTV